MTAPISAASAGGVVEQVGSYAGYASIIGLGVMALLYFSQARELKRLREWAGRAPERAAELEERVQADAQKRVVAQPLAATTAAGQQSAEARTAAATAAVYASIGAQPPGAPAAPVASAPGQLARPATPPAAAPGAVPAAPAAASPAPGTLPSASGSPAPAATPAPTLPPNPTPGARPIVTATPAPAPAPANPSAPAPSATATAPPSAPSAPQAATAAAAARVAAASRTVAPPPIANGSTSQDTTESAAARPEPLAPPRPAQGPARNDGDDDGGGLSAGRVGAIVGGAIVAIVVAVVLMITLTGGEDTPTPPNDFGNTPSTETPASGSDDAQGAPSGSPSSTSALTAAERRATDVAVLNGTTQTGLARNVGDKIEKAGFSLGSVGNNADQRVPTTIVSYTAGNRQAAERVAKLIGVDSSSVQAADANATTAATGDVIVTVGSDQIE